MKAGQSRLTQWPHWISRPRNSPGQITGVGNFPFSRGSSLPRDRTQVAHIAGRFFTSWSIGEAENTGVGSLSLLQHTFPGGLSGKESTCQCRRYEFSPWVRKIPWRRKWQSTPVILPGKSHGQRSLAGYIPWVHSESDRNERLCAHTHTTMINTFLILLPFSCIWCLNLYPCFYNLFHVISESLPLNRWF